MEKIQWTEEELKKMQGKSYIVCEHCGWYVGSPNLKADDKCPNCGKKYDKTGSKVQSK